MLGLSDVFMYYMYKGQIDSMIVESSRPILPQSQSSTLLTKSLLPRLETRLRKQASDWGSSNYVIKITFQSPMRRGSQYYEIHFMLTCFYRAKDLKDKITLSFY